MYLITFFIIITHAEILQSIPNSLNYLNPTMESQCENIELQENQYFYQDFSKETNVIYRYTNNFQGLVNERWNLTFIDLIYQDQLAPIFFIILSTQYFELDDKKYICSLLQNQENYTYQVKCKYAQPYQYIDNQPQFGEMNDVLFLIPFEEGLQCSSFVFLDDILLILCLINDQMKITTIDLKSNKQSYYFTISNNKCNSKVDVTEEPFIIVSFYQCKDWEILFLDYNLKIFQRITNKELIKVKETDSYNYLQDFHNCYDEVYLIFDQEYIQFSILSFLYSNFEFDVNANYCKIQELSFIKIQICQQKYHPQFTDQTINSLISEIGIQDLKRVATLGSSIILFQYPNSLIAVVTKEIRQKINIEINQIYTIFKDNILLIVDKSNQVHIFEANLFYNQLIYQQQGQYLGFYKLENMILTLIKCFIIFQPNDKIDKFQIRMQNLKRSNYLILIKDNFNNIWIDKFSFFFNRNIKVSFNFSNIFSLKKEQNENFILSKLKQLKFTGQFFLFSIDSQNYVMFNKEDQFIAIYNFNSSSFSSVNLKINLNSIQTYYEIKNSKFVLVQETLGKILVFKSSDVNVNMLKCQIHQFNEKIRISFLNQNSLIVQLVNTTEILFDFLNLDTFLNFSMNHFQEMQESNFRTNIQGAIKVLNFLNILIFQHESQLLIQIGFDYTLIINQKLQLLGGYIKRKYPAKIIFLGMNNENTTIYKYLITQRKFYQISTFSFQDYIPILPLYYQVFENIFIIITQKQDKDLYHILFFNMDLQSNIDYYDNISTPYQYFYASSGTFYYYNHNQELIEYNIQYFSIDCTIEQLDQIAYKEQFQLDLLDNESVILYSERLDLLLLNMQFDLQITNQSNPRIIMNNNSALLNPNTLVQGFFFEFNLLNSTLYNLQNPFVIQNQKQCLYFNNTVCIMENSTFFIVQDLTTNTEVNQTLSIRIDPDMKVYGCNGGVIIIEQYNNTLIKISYFKQDIECFLLIEDRYLTSELKQQILMVNSLKQIQYYFIDDSIVLIQSFQHSPIEQEYFQFHQIDSDKICQTLFEINLINILCFQLKQGITYTIQNYTIPTIDIYNSIDMSHFLQNFVQQVKFSILNLSSTLEDELDLKIAVYYKLDLLFYFQIILKHQDYFIKLNNIIRIPNFNMQCYPSIIQNKLLCKSESLSLFLYDLKSGFQLLNPYAVKLFNNEVFSQLNNTHIVLYNFQNNIITIYRIDEWRLTKNANISIDNEKEITLLAYNHLTQLEFRKMKNVFIDILKLALLQLTTYPYKYSQVFLESKSKDDISIVQIHMFIKKITQQPNKKVKIILLNLYKLLFILHLNNECQGDNPKKWVSIFRETTIF